jgi:hypothetical protein
MKKHPIQPLEKDDFGVIRFKRNAIVDHLLDKGGIDLNQIACMEFSDEDRQQFAQLIGYSLSGYSELGYVSDDAYEAAERMAEKGESESDARIAALEAKLESIRTGLRVVAAEAFRIHPDDLVG